MVRKHHKVLSLILCLMLAVSAICCGTVAATAATGNTIYFRPGHWTEAGAWFSVYAWDGNGGETFVKMTEVESGVYGADLGGSYANVIFCRNDPAKTTVAWGSVWNQTADLTVQSGTNCFAVNSGEWAGANGTWSTYSGGDVIVTNPVVETTSPVDNPTTPVTTNPVTTNPVTTKPVVNGTYTVYCKNTAGWSKVNCYMWNSGTDANATWPGVAMTNIGDNVWMYTASKQFSSVIFNSGSTQTDDLAAKYGYIYDNSKKTWEVYDTSPIQVTAYSADPAKDIYVGTDVVISATATSTEGGKVYYKMSVTNATGGTSVVSDFSTANKTTWTPNTAGDYTITIDFKDDKGNENSRTIAVTIGDDSSLVKPVIKSVVPTNLGLIKVGKTTNVTVKAGGGITGTNLLFYKYVVTDPNGVTNTPYYTLNNSYPLNPTMAGTYTVDVYVQGSDNSTVTRTYKYTATTEDITEPTTDIPVTDPNPTDPDPTDPDPTDPDPTNPYVILGDVDGDGIVSVKDATFIQKHVVDYEGYETVELAVGDVDGDGRISVKDATQIQKMIV